jgi:hypothetical protein
MDLYFTRQWLMKSGCWQPPKPRQGVFRGPVQRMCPFGISVNLKAGTGNREETCDDAIRGRPAHSRLSEVRSQSDQDREGYARDD